MSNWCFVIAVSRIEKQSREQAFNNQLTILYVGIYLTFYPYQSVYQSWLWMVAVFDEHNKLALQKENKQIIVCILLPIILLVYLLFTIFTSNWLAL